MDTSAWNTLKKNGEDHYKTGGVEPFDLFVAGGMFHDGACKDIIKYAFRSRREAHLEPRKIISNMNKVIDLAQKMIAFVGP